MRNKPVIVLCSLLFLSANLWALNLGFAKEDGGQAGAFLNFGAGARPMGMGRTFVGVADDASATYWNPAGLTQLKQQELTALYASLYEETGYSFVSYAHPTADKGTIGIAAVNLNSGGFKLRDEFNYDQGIASLNESAAIVSYGRALPVSGLSGGVNAKIVHQNIDSRSGTGYGADMGLFWTPRSVEQCSGMLLPLSLGLSLQNVIAPTVKLQQTADRYPLIATLGLSYRLFDNDLLLAADVQKAENQQPKTHIGGEYSFDQLFALRAGIDDTELTCGLGITWHGWTVDYAFAFHDAWSGDEEANLGTSHRFSLTMKFGNPR